MIRLVYLIRKRPDLDVETFRARWRELHADSAATWGPALGLQHYTMASRLDTVCNTCVTKPRGIEVAPYDGVIEMWWDSLQDYQAGAGSSAGLSAIDTLVDAERRFVDFSRSTAFFVEQEVPPAAASSGGHPPVSDPFQI